MDPNKASKIRKRRNVCLKKQAKTNAIGPFWPKMDLGCLGVMSLSWQTVEVVPAFCTSCGTRDSRASASWSRIPQVLCESRSRQWTNGPMSSNIQYSTSNIVIHKDKKFSGQKHSPTPRAMGFPSPIPGSVLHLTQTKLISTCAERSTSGLLDVALCGTLWHFMAL